MKFPVLCSKRHHALGGGGGKVWSQSHWSKLRSRVVWWLAVLGIVTVYVGANAEACAVALSECVGVEYPADQPRSDPPIRPRLLIKMVLELTSQDLLTSRRDFFLRQRRNQAFCCERWAGLLGTNDKDSASRPLMLANFPSGFRTFGYMNHRVCSPVDEAIKPLRTWKVLDHPRFLDLVEARSSAEHGAYGYVPNDGGTGPVIRE
jgi:hypothetical protein